MNRIQYRNMFVQVLLIVVTFGFYAVYWFYATSREMEGHLKREEPIFLWTVLSLIPILSIYSYYKQGELYEAISPDMNRWITCILWLLFPPAVWFIIQSKLNKMADESAEQAA